ncbi:nucleotide sugar dehydrogenase [Vibrio penaeicida]|uniref:Vi polysaccharide biosynthesis protein VipA/TviB n=1 Tax=Vibrio penaeicida TaxID=104609 RepID=A0AAV5NW97_9VIBR|nr:nucleotide sugar dehydrogenase [Vibrio penaeicida]GLQ74872.1 Vi polysaccharide biosynthesis protein VipA/TviB [Vibrio penaeicida]
MFKEYKIAVIGMGYVGLPLALSFGTKYNTIGYDISKKRIWELKDRIDINSEHEFEEFVSASYLQFSDDSNDLKECDIFIVTVPTPVTECMTPDFNPLISASSLVGASIKKGSVIIYESTVYPGATEQVCVPVIERSSGLKFNTDFFVGYSPERINPGDERKFKDIVKLTSGSTPESARFINNLYSSVVEAGTYLCDSVQVAEAAKVVENIQRDVNIALMNELSIIFNKIDLDIHSVLEACRTKWNFINFVPGLVGGHCIGIDPYYLIARASDAHVTPKLISTSRKINESISDYVVSNVLEHLSKSNINNYKQSVLVLGVTFKENCSDIRNSKVLDIIFSLLNNDLDVDVYDPIADAKELESEHNISLLKDLPRRKYNCVIFAVNHDDFIEISSKKYLDFLENDGSVFDLKNILPQEMASFRL